MSTPYVSSFGFKYNGKILISGEVLENLDGVIGDGPLVDLRYLIPISESDLKNCIRCDDCGRLFLTVRHKDEHRRLMLCMDEDGKLLENDVLLGRVGLSRTDASIIQNLPEAKRKELQGSLTPQVGL